MKTRVAIAVFLTLLPLITLAQTTLSTSSGQATAQQLLQALLPPNAIVPTASNAVTTTAVTTSVTASDAAKATLLQSLYAELQTLEAEIAAIEAAANHCTPLNLTRTLSLGSQGTDVTQLQQFLVTQGDLTATPSGYFGTLTQAAVIKFQTQNGISPVGSVGPITRAKITALTNSCTTTSGGSSSGAPTTPVTTTPPTSTSTAPGTPTTIINYTPPPSGGGGGGGGGSTSGGGTTPPPPPNYGSGLFAQFFQNGTLSIPSGSTPTAAPQITVNSLLNYSLAGANGNDSMLLPAGVIIQNSTNGSSIDVTTLTTQDIASSSVSGITTDTPVGVLQWGTPSIPLSFTAPITLAIAVDPGFNGDTLDVYDSESQNGPWSQTGLATPTCLITNGLCQFQTTSASFFAAAKKKSTVTISANPTTVSYGNSSTITWSSTNATSCTASNGWSGTKATSGTQTFTNLTTNQTYTLTCSNKASSATQSASVTVTGSAPDTTPPSAPTNLAGSATSPTQINLTWTASTDNVGVTGYNIYRAGTLIATSTLTSFSNTGLTASTQYTYTVKAFDAAGNISTASNAVNVTTQTPPVPTVTIAANPTSVTSGGSSTLTWSSTNATACTASGAWSGSKATSGTQSLTNLTATSTYTLTCTGAGGSANQSATIGVTALDTTPPSVTITAPASNLAAGTTQTTLAVTTNENATCKYSTVSSTAYASMTAFTTTGATSHTTTLSPLTNGTSYTYYVKCADTSGNISSNASVTFSVANPVDTTPPSVPTNLSATAVSSSGINLSWTASTDNVGVTGYKIFRGGTQIGTSATNSYSDSGLTAATQYSYTVSAYDAAGNNSAQSTSASATTQAGASTKFTIGEAVQVSSGPLNVRATANTAGTLVGTEATGNQGTVTGGPTTQGGYNWWDIHYNDGLSGWSVEDYLVAATQDTTPPTITVTAPTGTLPAGTTSTTLTVTTNETATCAYATTAGQAFASMTAFTTTGGTSHSTTLSGLTNGTSYTYYVKCKDTAGNISTDTSVPFSVAASAGDTTPPSVPTNLSATAVSSSGINLTWTASTDNVGVTGYKVYRGGTQIGTSATNSYSDSGLTASTQYTYTVSAYDAAGNNSAQSTSASATTQAASSGGGGDPTTGVLPSYDDAYANWKNAGLLSVGGIPNRTTVCATVNPLGGGQDDFTNIQNAINACPVGDVVQLAAGAFNIKTADLPIQINKGIVLRGTGNCSGTSSPYCSSSITVSDGILAYTGGQCGTDTSHEVACPNGGPAVIQMAPVNPDYNYSWAQCGNIGSSVGTGCGATPLTADAAQGDTTIHVSSTSGFSVGEWVLIDEASGAGWQPDPLSAITDFVNVWAAPDWLNPSGSPATGRVSWSKAQGETWDFSSTQYPYQANTVGCWHSYCDRPTAELHKIASIGTNTITFDDPLTIAFRQSGGHNAQVYGPLYASNSYFGGSPISFLQYAGVENLSVDRGENGGITMEFCAYCWIQNTDVGYWYNGGVSIEDSVRSELNNDYVHNAAFSVNSGGEYPIALDNASTEILITNSITNFGGKGMVARAGGAGSVVSYSYVDDSMYDANSGIGDYWVDMGLNASHYSGPHHVLFEGNWADNLDSDDTHGNSTYITFFRNQGSGLRSPFVDPSTGLTVNDFTGMGSACGGTGPSGCWQVAPAPLRAAGPMAYNYWFAFVGNVLGTAGETTAAHGWTYQGDWSSPRIWMLGWNDGLNGDPGGGEDPYLDGVKGSYVFRHGNFDYVNNAIADWTSGYSQTLPNSFYLTSEPSFFGTNGGCNYSWPWVTPTGSTPLQSNSCGGSGLPAKARWDAGTPLLQSSGSSGDTTPPSTPTNLAATAQSSSAINLTWTASTDNVGVTGYKIYRGGTQIGTSGTNSYSDTGLTASTQYSYTVSAYDAAGNNSAQSSSASATTQAAAGDTTPPSTPTNLSATAISSSAINLSWTASTDNVGVTGYKIFRGGVQVGTSGTNSYSDTGLTASAQYSYTVSAYDAAGNNSAQSSSASATTQAGGGGGGGTISFVQTIQTLNANHTASFTSNNITTSNGDMLVVALAFYAQAAVPDISSITLDGSTNFTVDKDQTRTATNQIRIVIATLRNVPAGAHTVTVTANGAISIGSTLFVSEFSGLNSAPADGTGTGAEGYSTTPSSGAFTTTANNDLWVAAFSADVNTASITAATGWTIPANGSNLTSGGIGYPISAFEYEIANNQTSGNGSFTVANFTNWAAVAIAYKAQ